MQWQMFYITVFPWLTLLRSSGEFSPCRTNNGGCQDLCLPTSDGRVNCSCRGDRKLLEDNTCSCKGDQSLLSTKSLLFKKLKSFWVCVSSSPALNMSCGSVDDFECGNGDCINYSLTCDGMAHCKDKSDEKQSYCGEDFRGHTRCDCGYDWYLPLQIICHSISIQLICFIFKCENWYVSEINYNTAPQLMWNHLFSAANRLCKKGYRRCINGRCIGNQFWCDGTDDCGDHSDELPCNSK